MVIPMQNAKRKSPKVTSHEFREFVLQFNVNVYRAPIIPIDFPFWFSIWNGSFFRPSNRVCIFALNGRRVGESHMHCASNMYRCNQFGVHFCRRRLGNRYTASSFSSSTVQHCLERIPAQQNGTIKFETSIFSPVVWDLLTRKIMSRHILLKLCAKPKAFTFHFSSMSNDKLH